MAIEGGCKSVVEQFEKCAGDLTRNWVWFPLEDGTNTSEIKDQKDIAHHQEVLIQKLEQCLDVNEQDVFSLELITDVCRHCFADESQAPWSTRESRRVARNIANKLSLKHGNQMEEALIENLKPILEEIRRRKLADNVTSTGHKQMSKMAIRDKLIGRSYTQTLDKMDEFKHDFLPSLGLLNALVLYYGDDIEQNWRYIMPLLLTLLDDTDSMVKREACLTLNIICDGLESSLNNIIKKSQTLPLFTKALQPLLLSLPSLTPERNSIQILPIAYDTMFKLYRLSIDDNLKRYSLLSALLNDTLLPSIGKCKDYIDLTLILMDILDQFLKECESFAIVLTKQIVYTLMTVLMDPYIAHSEKVIIAVIDIIQQCINNVPLERRGRYKFDVRGCMGTLQRRLDARNDRDLSELKARMQELLKSVDV